jgi:cell migration-inducing and hyaluronan-binding protein
MDDGSSVIFELPGFTAATGGAQKFSLAELRDAGETAWYSENGTLWAKLVVDNAAGLKVSLGSNAPPGFGAGGVPVGAKLDVGKPDGGIVQVAANER